MSSTYTAKTHTRGMVVHMLRGRETCMNGALIYKVNAWYWRHKGAHQEGSDVRISSTVRVRERHVIDRRASGTVHEEHMRHLAIV